MQYIWEELDISGKEAEKLARDIYLKIAQSGYNEGAQLPSIRDIAHQTDVTDYSARKVIFALAKLGLIEVRSRKGMYVAAGAKEKAIEMLRKYDEDFDLPHGGQQTTIAVAAAFSNTIDGPQIHHPQTVSGIYREAQALGFTVELINFNVDISNPDTIMKLVRTNGYGGIIWLYPEVTHWNSINTLRDSNIPVVLSSHWLFNTSLPCVQVNSYAGAVAVTEYLVNVENCDTVNWFSTELRSSWQLDDSDYAKVAASGSSQTLKLAMEIIGSDKCKLNIIGYDGCRVSNERTLKQLIDQSDCKNGIVIANTEQWSDFFKRNPESFEKIRNHSLVVASTINQFPRLEPIVENIGDIHINLVPFEDVGRALATKINDLLEGRFVDNTTLINPSFGTYSELLDTHRELCAARIGEKTDSLLLTV